MGTQIAILASSDDFCELLAAARDEGAKAVPEIIPLDDPPEPKDPEELFRSSPQKRLYLLPNELGAVEVFSIEVPNQPGVGKVNIRTSPVVEIAPARVEGNVMQTGRVYLGLSSSDRLFRPAKKLYDSIKKFTSSWPHTKEGIPIGPRAAEQVKSSGLALESNGARLKFG